MKAKSFWPAMSRQACVLVAMFIVLAVVPPATGNTTLNPGPGQSPLPGDLNSSLEIEKIIFSIDEHLMGKHIQALQDFGTRYTYRGDRCFQAADYIGSVFSRNGLEVYHDDFAYGYTFNYGGTVRANVRNVVGVKPGMSESNGTVIICGHYDSITPGSYPWNDAPGADDNGSGTAAVLAAAEILSHYEFNLTIKFIAFSGEEQGLRGSLNYRNGALAAGENITAVINLDMIANNPDPGSSRVKVYRGTNIIVDPVNLTNALNETWSDYGHITGVEPYLAGYESRSDHQPFAYFYESIFFHEDIFSGVYHSTDDTMDRLNLTYCANVTQIAVATIARMAEISGPDTQPPALTPGLPGIGTHAPALPTVSIEVTDPAGIDADSLVLSVNGAAVSPLLTPIPLGYNISYVPPMPYSDNQVIDVNISVADAKGNTANRTWSFTVDAVPPEPPADFTITAEAMRPTKRGTALDIGAPWDSRHALAPSVIYRDGEYKMWYTASNSTNRFHICYANSSDGVTWVKHGAVLLHTTIGQPDYLHAGHPEVIFEGEYRMWYSGYNGTVWQIMYANSTDGTNWTRHGVVLGPGPQGSPDSVYSMAASVLKMGEYRMWYTGYDGLKFSILFANSTDGITWTRHNASLISPEGPGSRWGDAFIAYPTVIHDGTEYRMWYNRVGVNYFRTHLATSADGLLWNDRGIAMEAGIDIGTRDRFQATHCSVMLKDNETKIWYSGFDGNNWRILFANITPGDRLTDLTLSWTPSSSPDVVGYEVFRESRPSAFSHPPESGTRASPAPPADLTPWAFETASAVNVTVYGPVAGSDPNSFYLPQDNILDIKLYISSGTGAWTMLAEGPDYGLDPVLGYLEITSPHLAVGCTVHAWYNHSAGRALRVFGNSVTDPVAGSSLTSYYYMVRAVDRAGNTALCADIVGRFANDVAEDWNLLGNPFLQGPTPLAEAFSDMDWVAVRTWDPERWPNHWTSSIPGRNPELNSLQDVDGTVGVWVKAGQAGMHASLGKVSDIGINLSAGWNLVSYPYHEYMSVSQALAGIPWDRVETMDAASPYLLQVLDGNSILGPGQGLWVRVTSDAVWHAINLP